MERAVPAQHLGNGLAAPGNALGDTGNGLSPGLQVVDVHNREACLAELTGQLRPQGVHCDSPLGYQHINAGPGGGDAGDPVGDDGQPGPDQRRQDHGELGAGGSVGVPSRAAHETAVGVCGH